MREFTKAQELAAECGNMITYSMTMLELAVERNKTPSDAEIKFALGGLRKAAKIVNRMSSL